MDIGTTYTAAAIRRDGRSEMFGLGNSTVAVPSMVVQREDGEVLVGEAAARRAVLAPERAAREFKRRIGDPAPILVGGSPYSADALIGIVLRWVVDQVAERQGEPPSGIAVCHPANWGEYKLDLLRQAISRADLDDVVLVSEPEAAAIQYASEERVEAGSVVVVYDLGGGTFDVAVLRRTAAAWEILGEPQGVERLGGIDFDEAVFGHVIEAAGVDMEGLDLDDRGTRLALTRLRQECVEAKEALSSDTATAVPVAVAGVQGEVRLTRAEFEAMVRPPLAGSITAVGRALRSAGVAAGDVHAVLLVGGSSRVPLVAQLVGSDLGRPVAVDAHPKHCVALGAATVAERALLARAESADGSSGGGPAPASPVVGPVIPMSPPPRTRLGDAPEPRLLSHLPSQRAPQGRHLVMPDAVRTTPRRPGQRRPGRKQVAAAVGTAAALVVSLVVWNQVDGNGHGGLGTQDRPTNTTATTATTATTPDSTTTSPPSPGRTEVARFDETFNGTAGEGQEVIDWLGEHYGEPVHLDLAFTGSAGEPAETDSPILWTECTNRPEGTPPSATHCTGWVLHVRSDDTTPFSTTPGGSRLVGYYLVATGTGPLQGLFSQALVPISAEQATTGSSARDDTLADPSTSDGYDACLDLAGTVEDSDGHVASCFASYLDCVAAADAEEELAACA